jgi:hypothetical protein
VVPKAEHTIALLMQPCCALLISLLPQSVLPAVKLNNKTGVRTKEVNNKGAKSMLPTELYPGAL